MNMFWIITLVEISGHGDPVSKLRNNLRSIYASLANYFANVWNHFVKENEFLWSLHDKKNAESEGVTDEASKPSARRGHLSANLTDDLNQQQWSVPGRGKYKGRDSKLGMSFGF